MEDGKKKIIINEINFWKENQMIPNHYCDFLLALYQQGEGDEADSNGSKGTKSVLKSQSNTKRKLIILFSFLTLGCLVYLIFATSYIIIPLSVASALLLVLLFFAFRQSKSNKVIVSILYILSALLLLGISLKTWIEFFGENPYALISLIVGNCLLWILAGRVLKLIYFTISGFVGIVISIYFIFFY